MTINIPRSVVRNPYAQLATTSKAGVFKHRNTPRGGGRNNSRDYLDEFYMEDDNE